MTAAFARTSETNDDASPQPQNPLDLSLNDFLHLLPKVELHAHLNGCVRDSTLKELAAERRVNLSPHLFAASTIPSPRDPSDAEDPTGSPRLYNARPRSLQDCFDLFAEIPLCVDDLPALRRITREALEDFAAHRVAYLELRSTPKVLLQRHGEPAVAAKRDYIETVLASLKAFQREQEQISSSFPLRCRFIVAIDRSQSLQDANEHVDLAIEFHRRTEYVVGVDLGGNPSKGDFHKLLPILQRARDAGLRVTLHCAEVPCGSDRDETDSPAEISARREAAAMLDFRPDRLGHALLLSPALRKRLSELRIPVETCPTSNVMTLELAQLYQGCLLRGLSHHPSLAQWLAEGYPLAVGTDDPGVFDTDATAELELVARAFHLSNSEVAELVTRSVDHVFCGPDLKREIRRLMEDTLKDLGLPARERAG